MYAVPVAVTAISGQALNAADRFMVSGLAGKVELASYYANYVLAERPVGLAFAPILAAAQPLIFRLHDSGQAANAVSNLNQLLRLYVCVAVPLIVFLSLFATDLSDVITGGRYSHGAIVIPLVAVGATLWNVAMVVHQPLEIAKSTQVITVFVAISALINILANLIFIPIYGGPGAAASTLLAFGAYLAMIANVIRRRFGTRRPAIPVRKALIVAAISLMPALLVDAALRDGGTGVRLSVAIIVGAVTVLFLLKHEVRSSRR
jgi:O-antigen/teichoic acid export membrane protein